MRWFAEVPWRNKTTAGWGIPQIGLPQGDIPVRTPDGRFTIGVVDWCVGGSLLRMGGEMAALGWDIWYPALELDSSRVDNPHGPINGDLVAVVMDTSPFILGQRPAVWL